jgi:L-rhamnose isomerase/sugar isomerase
MEFEDLADELAGRGIDAERVLEEMGRLEVETPSWGYGPSGTRFKVFPWPGQAHTLDQKLSDAAEVHHLTGIAPGIAIHVPWDACSDWTGLAERARRLGLRIGTVNPNLFQDDAYRLGSLCHPDPAIRRRALDHVVECVIIARQVGSVAVSLWLPDGTNYPGQDAFRSRWRRLEEALVAVYAELPAGMRLLLEYKPFEPAFYHTDLADWGMALSLCRRLGPRAQVLVDLGHHALGTNIEQLVAFLLDEHRLGGFHFNAHRYADDDLIVGSANPLELFLIFAELRWAVEDEDLQPSARAVCYMIDQSPNIEPKVEAMVLSLVNLQVAHTRAWLIDRQRLAAAQAAGDVLGAHRLLMAAFETDVRPLLAEFRRRRGLPLDPLAELRRSGYQERAAAERGSASVPAAGYPEA